MRQTARGLFHNARTLRSGRSGRRARWAPAAVLAVALVAAGGPASDAFAARGLITGLDDFKYSAAADQVRNNAFQRTLEAKARLVRINVDWRTVAETQPSDPANPVDPAYDFSPVDRAVSEAASHGLDVLLTVYDAPTYAVGPGRPPDVRPGTWRPDPTAFAAFGRAVARRYSGSFGGLPRVRYYEAWNEPNLPFYITPQWQGSAPESPEIYRALVNAFYAAVKGVDPSNQVLAGSFAPYGDPASKDYRMRPLRFARALFCLKNNLKKAKCPEKPTFDILSDHPIDMSGGARTSAVSPDDVATPDLGRLRETLRAAERAHTIAGGKKRHALWATEIWWETNPPDEGAHASLSQQARWIEEALYLLWKDGAKVVINLPLIDPSDGGSFQSGLIFDNGNLKPSFTAFRFAFVTERRSKKQLFAWGKSPGAGKLEIQKQAKGGWRTVDKQNVSEGEVFTARLDVKGKAKLRAVIGSEESLVWAQRR